MQVFHPDKDTSTANTSAKQILNCFICGNQYAIKRIENHVHLCEQKWEQDQKLKPKEERIECPKAPPGFFNTIRRNLKNHRLEVVQQAESQNNEVNISKSSIGNFEEQDSFRKKPIEPYKKEDPPLEIPVKIDKPIFNIEEKVDV